MDPKTKLELKFVLHGWAANSTRRSEGEAFIASNPEEARMKIEGFNNGKKIQGRSTYIR